MRTYDEAYTAARDGSPFSNGTMGYAWMANWCDKCVHDRELRAGEGPGCPHIRFGQVTGTDPRWPFGLFVLTVTDLSAVGAA